MRTLDPGIALSPFFHDLISDAHPHSFIDLIGRSVFDSSAEVMLQRCNNVVFYGINI